MLGVLIATVVAVVALVLVAGYVVRAHAARHEHVDHELHDPRTPTLEFAVPRGSDPAVFVAALRHAGYETTVDSEAGPQVLLVKCPRGIDRERDEVRAVIESADTTTVDHQVPTPAHVRFRDEE